MMGGGHFERDNYKFKMHEMSPEDKRKSMFGDKKQGDKLVKKKFNTPSYHAKSNKVGSIRK